MSYRPFKPTRAWQDAFAALYGDKSPPVIAKKKKQSKKESENSIQIKLCTWMDKKGILYYAIPNGGHRNYLEAVNFKRAGVKAGVPDLFVAVARKSYHGLYIELKRDSKFRVSDAQQEWIQKLNNNDYLAVVCAGLDAAKKVIADYLSIAYD